MYVHRYVQNQGFPNIAEQAYLKGQAVTVGDRLLDKQSL